MRSMVEGACNGRIAPSRTPSTPPLRAAVPLPVPGEDLATSSETPAA